MTTFCAQYRGCGGNLSFRTHAGMVSSLFQNGVMFCTSVVMWLKNNAILQLHVNRQAFWTECGGIAWHMSSYVNEHDTTEWSDVNVLHWPRGRELDEIVCVIPVYWPVRAHTSTCLWLGDKLFPHLYRRAYLTSDRGESTIRYGWYF